MAYHLKNPEVERLMDELARLAGVRKVDALRIALRNELERRRPEPSLVEKSQEFARDLKARTNPTGEKPADKLWIDSLYE